MRKKDEKDASKAARALSKRGASKGGRTRAARMTKGERSASASAAARARWSGSNILRATHVGEIRIGDLVIPCAVLEDGRRVLSQRGVSKALGRSWGGKTVWRVSDAAGDKAPPFLGPANLKPFLSDDLMLVTNTAIRYRNPRGGGTAIGLDATLLPQVCDVWLKARDANALQKSQVHIAAQAEAITRALANVAIIALVDEATGYQEVRPQDALQRILEMFIAKELLPWTKMFPDVFFDEIFRLRRWEKKTGSVQGPRFAGRIINAYIYGRLPVGVLAELRRKNPPVNGRRKNKHHQHLTLDVGHPALSQHIRDTWTIMRTADSWSEFHRRFLKVFPKAGDPLELPLHEVEDD